MEPPADPAAAFGAQRVALVLATTTGGVGRHVAGLVAGLVASGREVHMYAPAATDAQFGYSRLGATVTPVEIPASPQPRDATVVRLLRREFSNPAQRPDVVHAHGLRAGLVAALARPEGCPLIVTWHNRVLAAGLRAQLYRQLERYVARATDVTLAVSADLVERARALGGRDVRPGAVVAPVLTPSGRLPDEVRAELGAADGQPIVLAVGRLHPQKRFDVLVAAAARWRTRVPVPLVVIAGSGPTYLRLAGQISQMRAPVTLLGHRTDVADLLGAADLAVVTSDWEGSQLFAHEVLQAGVPLISTAVGGMPEVVGDAAVLVPARDIDAVDAAVQRLLDDPAERAEYVRRGAAQAATWPTEADTVAQVAAVYEELTGRAGRVELPAVDGGPR